MEENGENYRLRTGRNRLMVVVVVDAKSLTNEGGKIIIMLKKNAGIRKIDIIRKRIWKVKMSTATELSCMLLFVQI